MNNHVTVVKGPTAPPALICLPTGTLVLFQGSSWGPAIITDENQAVLLQSGIAYKFDHDIPPYTVLHPGSVVTVEVGTRD